ncbi:MAG: hypothetical protein ABJ045_10675, partial [Alteripontixanthobacter sp.]
MTLQFRHLGHLSLPSEPILPPRRTPFIDYVDRGIRAGRRLGLVEPARLEKDYLLESTARRAGLSDYG